MNLATIRHQAIPAGRILGEAGSNPLTAVKVFFGLVLPLSLLPPAVLLYGREAHPLLPTSADAPWERLAVTLFFAQIAAFAALAWLVKAIGAMRKIDVAWHEAYLVAGISPVPIWLSSLAPLVGNLAITLVIGLGGLWLSVFVAFRLSYALGREDSEVVATGFASSVAGVVLIAWALLSMLIAMLA